MDPYTIVLKLTPNRSRLLLVQDNRELLRASLPPPATFWWGKPAKALLESLSIWLNARLRVVLDVDERVDGFSMELTDEFGVGLQSVFYEVATVERERRRPHRLRGVDNFRDVRQLVLPLRVNGGAR
jgi:hypothetical protein